MEIKIVYDFSPEFKLMGKLRRTVSPIGISHHVTQRRVNVLVIKLSRYKGKLIQWFTIVMFFNDIKCFAEFVVLIFEGLFDVQN